MGTKLKDILNESVLGELPSSKMFKYNKATGKFEAPGQHTNEESITEKLPTEKKIGDKVTLSSGEKATISKRLDSHRYAVKTDSGQNKVINIDNIKEEIIKEEYVESMDHIKIANALGVIKKQWDEWKRGPLTEPSDIKPAQKELIDWVTSFLKKEIK